MIEGKPFPGGPRPGQAGVWPAVAAFLAATAFLLVVGGGYIVVTRSGVLEDGPSSAAARSPQQPEPTGPDFVTPHVPTAAATGTPNRPREATTPDGIAALSESSAARMLVEQASLDEFRVRGLQGYWVPQVSSKCPGVEVDIQPGWRADGIPETPRVTMAQIAAFHLALRERFGALTTRPTTLGINQDVATGGVCQDQPVWISVVPDEFLDAAAANSWCDAQGIPARECQARLVAPGGNTDTVPRR